MKQKSKNYFKYVFKNLLILSGSLTVLLCLLLYFSYLNFTRSAYLQSLKNSSKQSAELIDNCILQSNNLVYLLSNDDAIKDYVNSDSDYSSKSSSAMHSLRSGWLFHGDIAAITPDRDTVITNSTSMRTGFYLDSIGLSSSAFQDSLEELISGTRQSPIVLFPTKNTTDLVVMHIITNFDKPLYIVSTFDLSQILPKTKATSNFCIRHGDELIDTIGTIGLDDIEKAFLGKSFKYKTLSATAMPIPYFSGNECFYVVPTFDYIKQSHNFAFILLLIALLIAAIAYMITSFISNKIYTPVQELVTSMKDSDDVDTQDELEYISKKFDSLSGKNKTLFDLVASHSKQLSDIFFIKLLNASLIPDDIDKGIKEYSYSVYRMPVAVFVAKITNYDTFNNVLDVSGIHILKNDILKLLAADFGENELKTVSIENDRFVGIITAENLLSQKRRLILCTSKIETYLEARIRIYVGEAVRSWYDLSSSYNSALNIMDNFYFRPSSASVILSSEISDEDAHIYYPAALDNTLLQAIIHGQNDKIKEVVDEIIDNNYKIEILRAGLHSQLVMMLVASLTKVFMTLNKSPEEILSQEENIYATLIQYTDPEQLKEAFLSITYRISDYTDSLNDSINQKITQIMLSYIYENYSSDISLSSLAAHVNLSQSHTSRLFKQLTGENFKDYLAKYRISMAKNILDNNPSVKIKDLATAVGYSSSDILNKVFMRYEGYLPSEYHKY